MTKTKKNLSLTRHSINLSVITDQHFNDQISHHIETSKLICSANQLTGFYMMGTLLDEGLM